MGAVHAAVGNWRQRHHRRRFGAADYKVDQPMEIVIIESPFAGDVEKNLAYCRAAMHDCLVHHCEAPFASHALYTQPGVLRDDVPIERELGMKAGFLFRHKAARTVVYEDLGISYGMEIGIAHARRIGHEIVYRSLDGWA